MHARSKLALTALFFGIGLLAGCGGKPVITVMLPETGTASEYGQAIRSGAQLAYDQRKAQLPENLVVLWRDTKSSPENAVELLETAVRTDGSIGLLGGATSDEAAALLTPLEHFGVPLVSPSASAPELTNKNGVRVSSYFYRIFPSDELEATRAAKFLAKDLGTVDTVVLYTGSNEYSRGFEPAFRRQFEQIFKGKIGAKIDVTAANWEEESRTQLAAHNPEAVYIVAFAENVVRVLEHLKTQRFDGVRCTTSAFFAGESVERAGELAEGLFFPLPPFDPASDDDATSNFVQAYTSRSSRAPDIYAAYGYDAMNILLTAVSSAKPRSQEVRRKLSFDTFDGLLLGEVKFNDYGEVKNFPQMFLIDKGKLIDYHAKIEAEKERIRREQQRILDELERLKRGSS